MSDASRPIVLVVDDEPDVIETYEMMLGGQYDLWTATDGEAALEMITNDVDVVLLDRMLPEMAGADILDAIRSEGFDCGVAIVTAVEPDFEVIEMGFDAYLTKPPTQDQLRQTVQQLFERSTYDEQVREYYSLLSKRAALQSEKPEHELAESDEYAHLEARIEEVKSEVTAGNDRLRDDAAFVSTLRGLTEEDDSA